MKKKLKGLNRFVGMTWARAKSEINRNVHMLVFDEKGDPQVMDVVGAYRDFGIDYAMATLVALLFIRRYGASSAALKAVEIYKDISKKLKADPETSAKLKDKTKTLDFELNQMEDWIWYANPRKTDKWPLKPHYEKRYEVTTTWAGQANVMLYYSMVQLFKEGTTGIIAASGIQRFIEKANKNKEK